MNFTALITFIQRAVCQGIPLLYGSTGEILTEKSGNLNLGIPGIMYAGAISGVMGAFFYEESLPTRDAINPFLAILIPTLCALIGSARACLLFPDRNAQGKSECNRSCHHHFRCRLRQLFRRFAD